MIVLPAHGCAALLHESYCIIVFIYLINYVVSMYIIECQLVLTCRRAIDQRSICLRVLTAIGFMLTGTCRNIYAMYRRYCAVSYMYMYTYMYLYM